MIRRLGVIALMLLLFLGFIAVDMRFDAVPSFAAPGSKAATSERLPGQVARRTSYDTAGKLVSMTYTGQGVNPATGLVEADQVWLGWSSLANGQGQVVHEWTPDGGLGYTGQLGATAIASDLHYSYDKGGRLTRVEDRTGNATAASPTVVCQTRTYGFDLNGNRTGQGAYQPGADGGCQTATGSTTTRSYDTADRPTTSTGGGSYSYDALGRQTTIPASDTPHAELGDLQLGYYDTDAAYRISQGSGPAASTTTFTLDPAARRLAQTTVDASGTSVLTRHYTDGGDSPTWTAQTDPGGVVTTTRYAELVNGDLSLTLTTTGSGPETAELALATPRGDTAATVPVQTGAAATGIDRFSAYTEYGTPRQSDPTTPGGVTGIGYGWLGAKQRATIAAGLVLMGARLYNQVTGLFTSLDPVHHGGDTAYGYPNDPINKFDLEGNNWRAVLMGIGTVAELVSFLPGPVGMIASAVAVGAYAAGGCWTCAAGAALGFIPGAKLTQAVLRSSTKIGRLGRRFVGAQSTWRFVGAKSRLIGKGGVLNRGKYLRIGWSAVSPDTYGRKGARLAWRIGHGVHKKYAYHISNRQVGGQVIKKRE